MSESKMSGEVEGCRGEEERERSSTLKVGEGQWKGGEGEDPYNI